MQDDEPVQDARDQEQPTASQSNQAGLADKRQPEGRQFAGSSEALRGNNADDNSGSGGTEGGKEIKGRNVAHGTHYEAPGNADEGDVGGSTTSSGTGVSGGETGKVNL
ncbi:hypothetical protein [Hymenobacter sp. BT491]|uniref:hypothetical protein n=1 Tax=Hymenobacter sp. BT491 TaxID=2766779 RepID=UPI001653EDAD|nr:hypothetical protein [Hymenobacter sp. BT491]MBC6990365.1 hypothetical protein [Hymenobacter sp. BT491]